MLMLAIITWGEDLIFKPIESMQQVKDLRRRIGSENRDFILYEGHPLCPVKMDDFTKELTEDEIIEFMNEIALPALLEEGRIKMKNGRYISNRNKVIRI